MDTKQLSLIPLLLALAACDIAGAAGQRVEGGFDRSLTVSGPVDLEIRAGSGRIDVRSGEAGRIHVVARIVASDNWSPRRSRLSAEERVRRLEATPPIEQSGNRVRIGVIDDTDLQNVSISYTVTVPAGTALVARNGSGSIDIEGIDRAIEAHAGSGSIRIREAGGDVTAETGSGSIEARRVGGAFRAQTGSGAIAGLEVTGAVTVQTGSGSIEVSQRGGGDVTASSSSGSIDLKGIRGGLTVKSSSGTVRAAGEQTSEWRLSTSSGGVYLDFAGEAAFELDAHSNSGGIDLAFPITVSGKIDRRTLRGPVNGGGPLLHVRTSSGGIHIK
jgi:DUF4097 and DUF4098 domain-containing protein YvlB